MLRNRILLGLWYLEPKHETPWPPKQTYKKNNKQSFRDIELSSSEKKPHQTYFTEKQEVCRFSADHALGHVVVGHDSSLYEKKIA